MIHIKYLDIFLAHCKHSLNIWLLLLLLSLSINVFSELQLESEEAHGLTGGPVLLIIGSMCL